MAVGKGKRSALGANPLSQSIFSKTTPVVEESFEEVIEDQLPQAQPLDGEGVEAVEPEIKNQEKRIKKKESRFLNEEDKEKVNLRLSVDLNDWLDDLLKQGKRKHGQKIPKELWVQAALELFRAMPVDWVAVDSEEALRDKLSELEVRFLIQDS